MTDNASTPRHPAADAAASTDATDFGYQRVPRAAKKPLVRAVFDSVAPRYDLMNDLMSLGIHRAWKRVLLTDLAPRPERTLLDLAGGTGDVGFSWRRAGGGPVIVSDINAAMLDVARKRATAETRKRAMVEMRQRATAETRKRATAETRQRAGALADGPALAEDLSFLVADAERLPLRSAGLDTVSMAFGLRNCTDKEAVLREARRVLRPGGRFLCLEFSQLQVAALAPLYDAWSFQVLPRLGRLIANDAASYQYLAESIRTFPDRERLAGMMRHAGFQRVNVRTLSGGIACIHSGWRL